ncbi:MAG: helix-turn-helix domain-containing protein [Clostridia bacterium]
MWEDTFKDRLVELRLKKNVSARDMSLSMGQNPGYINNIESGKALPSLTGFFYICEYLDITPQEFFDTDLEYPEQVRSIINDLKKLDERQLRNISEIVKDLASCRG